MGLSWLRRCDSSISWGYWPQKYVVNDPGALFGDAGARIFYDWYIPLICSIRRGAKIR